ncbi:hypothetical protein [Microbacterium paludicola]|uniref:hypothetical protein n=1 Tax=Microbacterium paludicola TaxID=300019 RepID=UPI0031DDD68D
MHSLQHATVRWYAHVFRAIPAAADETDLVWERLAPKTRALVHAHMTNVRVDDPNVTVVIADAETIRKMVDSGQLPPVPEEYEEKSAEEIVDSIAARVKKRLEGGGEHVAIYQSIAERLERLRAAEIERAEDSIAWLTKLFDVATDLTAVERAEETGEPVDLADPRIGMLTRIFEENTPAGATVLIADVVAEVDELVRQATFDGWASREDSQRAVKRELRGLFGRKKLPRTGEPFDSAWAYIISHY